MDSSTAPASKHGSSVRCGNQVSLVAHGASSVRDAAHRVSGGTSARMSDFLRLSSSWDRGSRCVRERILADFVASCKSMTAPQLETELAQGASLFLTRITAWLRLSYLLNYNLALLLESIGVFVTAASRGGGTRFIAEFLETGGIFTLLEIISIAQLSEENKCVAMGLLIHICAAGGRKFKEFICESGGMRALYSCLAVSRMEQTQSQARRLLLELAVGNPAHIQSLYKSLLSQLTSTHSLAAQITASRTLTVIFPSLAKSVHASILEPIVALLKSPQLLLQHEGYELLRVLLPRPELARQICHTLTEFLDMIIDDGGNGGNGSSFLNNSGSGSTTITTQNTSTELTASSHAKIGNADAQDGGRELGGSTRRRASKSRQQSLGIKDNAGNGNGKDAAKLTSPRTSSENLFKHQQEMSRTHFYVLQTYSVRLLSQLAATSEKWIEHMIFIRLHMALLITICNEKCPESQRLAADLLHFLKESSATVDEHLKTRLGQEVYAIYETQPLDFYKLLRREHILSIRRQATKMRRSVRLPPASTAIAGPEETGVRGRGSTMSSARRGTHIDANGNSDDGGSSRRQRGKNSMQSELDAGNNAAHIERNKSDDDMASERSSPSASKEALSPNDAIKTAKGSPMGQSQNLSQNLSQAHTRTQSVSGAASSGQKPTAAAAAAAAAATAAVGGPRSSIASVPENSALSAANVAKILKNAVSSNAKSNADSKDAKKKIAVKAKGAPVVNQQENNEQSRKKSIPAPSKSSSIATNQAAGVGIAAASVPTVSIYVPYKTIVSNSKLNACSKKEKSSILTIAREDGDLSNEESDVCVDIENSQAAREAEEYLGQKFEATTNTVQQLHEIADRNFQKELSSRFPEIMDAAAANAAMLSNLSDGNRSIVEDYTTAETLPEEELLMESDNNNNQGSKNGRDLQLREYEEFSADVNEEIEETE